METPKRLKERCEYLGLEPVFVPAGECVDGCKSVVWSSEEDFIEDFLKEISIGGKVYWCTFDDEMFDFDFGYFWRKV